MWREQPPAGPPANCTVQHVDSYNSLAQLLTSGWQRWAGLGNELRQGALAA